VSRRSGVSNIDPLLTLGSVLLSVLLDLRFGEPPSALHPVVGMGRYLRFKSRLLALSPRAAVRLVLGAVLVLVGASLCGVMAWGVERTVRLLPWFLELPLLALLLKPFFSISALLKAGQSVRQALGAHDLPNARRLLSWHLVSRPTAELSGSDVAGAAVASLAENLTDSIVAPLFYGVLFGLPGIVVYRFCNTVDAVLGYRTPELEHLGKTAARLDDLLNFIPARLSALLLLASLALTGRRALPAWRGLGRDHRLTPSPNGGWMMATVAHGLGIRLEKRGVYTLNAEGRAPTAADIGSAQHLIVLTLALALGLYALITLVVARVVAHA
jgi:adenosylcobinamide-phosphate synthase